MFHGMHYVMEVYKEQSFSKAAQNLYISQPALSAAIKKIEAKVGAPLFDRSTSPVQLTECGKEYIRTTEKILDLEDEFAYHVGNLHELKAGHLALGGTYFFASFIFPPFIEEFRQKYPHVNLNFYEGSTPELEQKLFSGELDIIIDNYALDPQIYHRKKCFDENLLVAVPAAFDSNHRAASYQLAFADVEKNLHRNPRFPGVPLKKFKDDPFVVLRAHNDTRERIDAICRRAGIQPNYILKLNQAMTTYRLTQFGMGISIVSDTLVRHLHADPSVIYYKIDAPEAQRDVYLYHKKNAYLTRAMQEFIRIAAPEA